ncbi:MAG: hypothetical protein ACK5PF_03725, partial [bacterium]
MRKLATLLRSTVALGAVGVALVAGPALAQTAQPQTSPPDDVTVSVEEIIVTGTRIPNAGLSSTSPISALQGEQIQLQRAV